MTEEMMIKEFLKKNKVTKCPDRYGGTDLLGNDVGGELLDSSSANRQGLKEWKKEDKVCEVCGNTVTYGYKTTNRKFCDTCSKLGHADRKFVIKHGHAKLIKLKELKARLVPVKYIAYNSSKFLKEQIEIRDKIIEINDSKKETTTVKQLKRYMEDLNKRSGFKGSHGIIDNGLYEINIMDMVTYEIKTMLIKPTRFDDFIYLDIPLDNTYVVFKQRVKPYHEKEWHYEYPLNYYCSKYLITRTMITSEQELINRPKENYMGDTDKFKENVYMSPTKSYIEIIK